MDRVGFGSRAIFKRVNRVAGQTGYRSNGSGQTGLTRFAMSTQNIGQLVGSPTLRAFQSFLQSIHNRLVSGFNLAVALRIGQGGIFVLDVEITTKLPKGSTIEL